MFDYLLAIALILLMMVGWTLVQLTARRYAKHHPKFGPVKEEGSGCKNSCLCSSNTCKDNKTEISLSGEAHVQLKRLR